MIASLDDCLAYGRHRLARALDALRARSEAVPPVTVLILDGPQEGCEATLTEAAITLGGGLEDDVMLLHPSVGEDAVTLRVVGSPLGPLLSVRDRRGVAQTAGLPPDGTPFRLPREVSIGEVRLRLSDGRPTAGAARSPSGPALLALLGAVLFGLAITPALSLHEERRPTPSEVREVASAADVDEAAELTTLLAERGLDAFLRVSEQGSDLLVVEGAVPEDRMRDWQAVHRAFDEGRHARTLLTRVRTMPDEPALPPIAVVRLSGEPALVLARGGELRRGDSVADGWTVQGIVPGAVTLARGAERVEVEF